MKAYQVSNAVYGNNFVVIANNLADAMVVASDKLAAPETTSDLYIKCVGEVVE